MLNSLDDQGPAQDFLFALNITGPILIILILGHVLRRTGLIDPHFIASGNKLVYNLSLPSLLFFSTVNSPLGESLDTDLVVFGSIATVLGVIVLSVVAHLLVSPEFRGVFIQGAFRSNMGIVGIAFAVNAFGPGILAKSSIYLALLTIVYNLLAVWVLRNDKQSILGLFLKNPLIVAVVLGVLVSEAGLRIPALVQTTGTHLSALTLPLALLCIGGSLRRSSFRNNHRSVVWACVFKLIIIPSAATLGALWYGFRGEDLGVLFLMMASPTAAASYVMARQMTAHGDLAAEIIAVTTAACGITVTIGLLFLKSENYL